jgi:hypothetical protein
MLLVGDRSSRGASAIKQRRTTLRPMKPEIAARMAGSLVAEITTEQAQIIIDEYWVQLTRCPACDSTGTFSYRRDLSVPITPRPGDSPTANAQAGADGDCPRCGGNGRDPDWVLWYCSDGHEERHCKYERAREPIGERHVECGLRLMVRLDES